jgi:hypothetical protein
MGMIAFCVRSYSKRFVFSVYLVEIQWDYGGVAGEVMVCSEDLPVAARGGGADEEVDGRSGDASGATLIVDVGGCLVIGNLDAGFVKGAELVAQFPEAGFLAYA